MFFPIEIIFYSLLEDFIPPLKLVECGQKLSFKQHIVNMFLLILNYNKIKNNHFLPPFFVIVSCYHHWPIFNNIQWCHWPPSKLWPSSPWTNFYYNLILIKHFLVLPINIFEKGCRTRVFILKSFYKKCLNEMHFWKTFFFLNNSKLT